MERLKTSLLMLALVLGISPFLLAKDDPAIKGETITSLEQLRTARAKLAAKPRRLLYNNDGCDALYFPADREATVENFLDLRTSPLAGTQVDTFSYCSISSGFGYFTHDTKAGTLLLRNPADFGFGTKSRNITTDLLKLGTDPLRAVADFAKAQGMGVFWSMRMNDTHDVAHRPDQPYFLFPPWKEEHPEWLVGTNRDDSPYGRWSSADYARPEIREMAYRYLEEVCRHYEIDGVELDFFRHLCYFKSVAKGGQANAEEIAAMTELMRRIRQMTEEVGLEKGRPILVAMRLPDSTAYALELGLDLETWLKEGLMDILMTTDYFRLNPWSYSVELGHRYGVPVYPALTDSRVKNESRFFRKSLPAHRARAAKAWAAGADALYIFNLYGDIRHNPLWQEMGDPKTLAFTEKLYFVTDHDGKPQAWLAGGEQHQTIPILTPREPAKLHVGEPYTVSLEVAEDFEAAAQAGREAKTTLHLEVPQLDNAARLEVTLNGKPLTGGKLNDGWLDLPLSPNLVQRGDNEIRAHLLPAETQPKDSWSLIYRGDAAPKKPWRADPGSKRIFEEPQDGAWLIADRGEQTGDYRYYRIHWGAVPDDETIAEVQVKVLSGSSSLIFANGVGGERLHLSPEGIRLYHQSKYHYKMDTTDDFHRYRVVLKGEDIKVYVDGKLRIDAPGTITAATGASYPRNEFAFGAANSGELGEALWREVKFRSARSGLELQDLVLSVSY